MSAIHFFLIFIAAFNCSLTAAVDSGGGLSALGGGANHSSIGGGFDTSASAVGLIEILYPEIPAGSDADANGLPDAWETQHFGSMGASASADADGDRAAPSMAFGSASPNQRIHLTLIWPILGSCYQAGPHGVFDNISPLFVVAFLSS